MFQSDDRDFVRAQNAKGETRLERGGKETFADTGILLINLEIFHGNLML